MHGPHIDWAAFSPLLALAAGGIVVLLVGLLPSRVARAVLVPLLSLVAIAAFAVAAIDPVSAEGVGGQRQVGGRNMRAVARFDMGIAAGRAAAVARR